MLALSVLLTLGITSTADSQELGVRFGQAVGGNFAFDAVFAAGEFSRIHADASFGDGWLGIEALWNPLYRPIKDGPVYWYAGVGPYFLLGDPFGFGISGEIGLEYKLKDAPIVIGGDWRPAISIVEDTDFWAEGFGVNIRYIFGKSKVVE
jgi:hypothetical protein